MEKFLGMFLTLVFFKEEWYQPEAALLSLIKDNVDPHKDFFSSGEGEDAAPYATVGDVVSIATGAPTEGAKVWMKEIVRQLDINEHPDEESVALSHYDVPYPVARIFRTWVAEHCDTPTSQVVH